MKESNETGVCNMKKQTSYSQDTTFDVGSNVKSNKGDIELYSFSPKDYHQFNMARPDYMLYHQSVLETARRFAVKFSAPSIAEFGCGPGNNIVNLSNSVHLSKAVLFDINPKFISQIDPSRINADQLETRCEDLLKSECPKDDQFDVVMSISAYHHVQDNDKPIWSQRAFDSLKPGGYYILGEIFLNSPEDDIFYYDLVYQNIPKAKRLPGLKEFLTQTANSQHLEFKVSKNFAMEDLTNVGFRLVEDNHVWPKDGSIGDDMGMFILVFQKPE